MEALKWIIQVFLFPMELLAAALLYTHSRKPRDTSKATGVLCMLLFILLTMWNHTLPVFCPLRLCMGSRWDWSGCIFRSGSSMRYYDITFTYATQYLAYQLANIIQQTFGLEELVQMVLIHLPVYAVVYYVAKRVFAPTAAGSSASRTPARLMPVLIFRYDLLWSRDEKRFTGDLSGTRRPHRSHRRTG